MKLLLFKKTRNLYVFFIQFIQQWSITQKPSKKSIPRGALPPFYYGYRLFIERITINFNIQKSSIFQNLDYHFKKRKKIYNLECNNVKCFFFLHPNRGINLFFSVFFGFFFLLLHSSSLLLIILFLVCFFSSTIVCKSSRSGIGLNI